MNPLRALPLKLKLPLLIVGLCLTSAGILQVVNTLQFRAASFAEAKERFDQVTHVRAESVRNLMATNSAALLSMATMPGIAESLARLHGDFHLLPEGPATLISQYIAKNPNPPGQRYLLDRGAGLETYHADHAAIHPVMRKLRDLHGFVDIFMVDEDFNVVYSVAKDADFLTSFQTGPYAKSNLAEVLHKAEAGKPGEVFLSDFSEYAASNGAAAAFIATKVVDRNGSFVGLVAAQISLQSVAEILGSPEGLGETGEVYLVGADMRAKSASRHENGFKPLDPMPQLPQIIAASRGAAKFFEDVPLSNGSIGIAESQSIDVMGISWGLVVERDIAEVMAASNALILKILLIGGMITAAALALGIFFSRSITKPISRISQAMDSIANGNLNITIQDADRGDELGVIAHSVNALLDKLTVAGIAEEERDRMQVELRHVVESLSAGMQELSMGNLTQPITDAFAEDYDGLRSDFNATLEKLSDTIVQVVEASQNIRARATEISSASEDLSRRTENQAAALEQTAAALDELTASVRSAAEGAIEVENIVQQARKEAEDSGAVVQGAVGAMAEIEKSSEQISQIIGAIDDIAFQTNLLALNAGVEAARAGDAGKGFAVVASEVRALAQRSSTAAKEIKTLIGTSAQHVGRGVDQVGKAGEALQSIVTSVANISTLVSTIAAGAAEQSTGLAEINIGVTQLDQVTQQNAAMVEESTAASHSLNHDATGLAELVAKFRVPQTEAQSVGAISLTHFRPSSFASSETLLADSSEGHQAISSTPSKVAVAGTKAIWQDF
ncbi:methyl-accepting chemotaxis protein [Rhodobacter ferrooxidans]|uniref:Methyl-accepting chemotaxis sensory transducer n=1 Tax=Rhodobacter ferrooxidans TaxID=371731 RepID=C8S4D6_9RHOB|nr:methyl-accepting chemotaxis protein [Rhodobacter sp. SW2]EEW24195.1 methyl-accepting chemotaxis sensory transducer [Rhodobacter sp. SW2]